MPDRCPRHSTIRTFLCSEDGTVAVDFALWLPVILLTFGIIADTSLIFGTKAQILRVIQDANRAASVGKFRTTAETVAYITTHIAGLAPTATITSVVTSGIVSSTVTVPARDLDATGLLVGIISFTVTISAQHMLEA